MRAELKSGLYKGWAWSMQEIERFSPRTKDRIVRQISRAHVAWYRRSPESSSAMAAPTLLFTVRGRKSGQLRTTPLFYMPDGNRFVVVGSYGGDHRHPQWYRNAMAEGEGTVEVAGDKTAVTAELASPAERAELWPRLLEIWPSYTDYEERQQSRQLPVVILTSR